MTDIFLYQGQANPNDVRLTDPTVAASTTATGTGALVSTDATVSGTGISLSTGTGVLLASAASVSGVGQATDTSITGSGALAAQAANVAGVGLSSSAGTGALATSDATISSTGISESTGTGALAAQAAAASAAGITRWVARSDLYQLENGTDHYLLEGGLGNYAREEVTIVSGAAQISGVGESSSTGTGELLSGNSQVSGVDEIPVEARGGGIPARKRRRYIMPDDSVVYATTEEVIDLLRLYAVPVAEVKVEKQRSVKITMPQIVLEKRDVRFLPGAAPDTWKAVISERFAYQPPPEATRHAEILANRIRADEEAILALLM